MTAGSFSFMGPGESGLGRTPAAAKPENRHWYIVHRTDKRLSPLAQAFKEFVLGQAQPATWSPTY